MPLPKIISEEKSEIPVRDLPSEINGLVDLEVGEVIVYLHYEPAKEIVNHAMKNIKNRLEVMGYLIGDVFKTHNEGLIIEVTKVLTSDLDATSTTVKFAKEGLAKVIEMLDDQEKGYMLIGWYHSHPGYTCFLSSTDIRTQMEMFPMPYHLAIVIDPIYEDIKAFSVIDGQVIERSIIDIFSSEEVD